MTLSRLWRGFWRDKNGKVVIWQAPNIYLWSWLVLTVAGHPIATGTLHKLLGVLAFVALIIWSCLEIKDGDSYFRRTLGGVVLLLSILSRVR